MDNCTCIRALISIHAPSRERPLRHLQPTQRQAFQSTLPRGSDVQLKTPSVDTLDFNPRSLAGATSFVNAIKVSRNFNPRSLAGATVITLLITMYRQKFQSTLPRGSDARCIEQVTPIERFQSTLPRGSDTLKGRIVTGMDISIHAPSRERRNSLYGRYFWLNFNPRSLAGATLPLIGSGYALQVFQSTLPRGSDSIKTNYFSIHLNQAFFAN